MKQYTINEMFWSPQGEGARAGEMSVFIRFTGCNLRCRMEVADDSPGDFDCDTEFASGRKMSADEIVAMARELTGKQPEWFGDHKAWVVFTGGEPSLQLDRELVAQMQEAGFRCAIESNGSRYLTSLGVDWITISPKVAEHAVRQLTADEVRYVRGYGQAIPKPACRAPHQWISPAFNGITPDAKSIEWCFKLIRENPEWKVSIQQHKLLHLR